MNKRQEGVCQFVVSRSDASEMLDAGEESLDQIAIPVKMMIEGSWSKPIGSWRNYRLSALSRNGRDECIRIVTLVGNDVARLLILDQRGGMIDVGYLSCRQNDAQRIAERIDGDM